MRRLRVTTLLLAAVLAATMLLGACTGRGGQAPPPGDGAGQVLPEPQADVQEITLTMTGDPPSLDPSLITDTQAFLIAQNVLEGLVRLGEGGGVEQGSGQAASWTVSGDGTVYTFRLRDGAAWSDGRPVTAGDFAYSWLRTLDPRTQSPYAYQLYYIRGAQDLNSLRPGAPDFDREYERLRSQVGIAAPDDQTLEVTLEAPTPYFLSLLAFPTYLPVRADVVAAHGAGFGTSHDTLVYNGPFRLAAWERERELVLEKNPAYWDAAAVRLNQVRLLLIRDANTALNMFIADELDEVSLPGEFLDAFRDRGLQRMALGDVYYLAVNVRRPALTSARVRQALALAVDRTAYVDTVTQNGAIIAQGMVPPGIPGAGDRTFRELSGGIVPARADAGEARRLLEAGMAELGMAEFPKLRLLTADSSTAIQYAEGLQAMWREHLGIQVDIEPVSFTVRLRRGSENDFDILSSGWVGDYNDPMTFLELWTTGNSFNDPRWSNQEYDRLIQQARGSADPQVRVAAMAEAERMLLREAPVIPLYHSTSNWLQKDWLHGVRRFAVGGELDLKFARVQGRVQ